MSSGYRDRIEHSYRTETTWPANPEVLTVTGSWASAWMRQFALIQNHSGVLQCVKPVPGTAPTQIAAHVGCDWCCGLSMLLTRSAGTATAPLLGAGTWVLMACAIGKVKFSKRDGSGRWQLGIDCTVKKSHFWRREGRAQFVVRLYFSVRSVEWPPGFSPGDVAEKIQGVYFAFS